MCASMAATPVCYELEAGPVVLGELEQARQAERRRQLDLVGVGSCYGSTVGGDAAWGDGFGSETTLSLTLGGDEKDGRDASAEEGSLVVDMNQHEGRLFKCESCGCGSSASTVC